MLPSNPYIFANMLENPQITWSESYEMYGECKSRLRSNVDLSDYQFYNYFKARCKLCGQFSEPDKDSNKARLAHFKHCSREHGYIFLENEEVVTKFSEIQQIIITSMLYDLPFPGYESHTGCVKQYRGNKPVCIIHY